MKIFKNKKILITGGTGSYGKFLTKFLLKNSAAKKIVIFSRDELKQFEMSRLYPEHKFKNIRYILGDIRDKERLQLALKDIDYVFHAAALKHVRAAEYNPFEFVKTNIIGSQNLIECCLNSNVKKVLALSTDKASSPTNLYGATKLCADKLFTSANNIKGTQKIRFSILRYGNVLGSRGSVLKEFKNSIKTNKKIILRNKKMTRFIITLEDAIKFSIKCLNIMNGGEIFVPKLYSIKIFELAKIVVNGNMDKIILTEPLIGEKLHEEMISEHDVARTYEFKDFFVISDYYSMNYYKNYKKTKFSSYNSDNNKFLSIARLKLIVDQVIRNNYFE